MFKLFRNLFKKNSDELKNLTKSPVLVSFDDIGIYLQYNGVESGSVKWSEIDLVAINIEDDFLPFPYWYIGSKNKLLRIPNDAEGGSALFFDGLKNYIDGLGTDEAYRVIIEASSAMEGSFIVWKSENVDSA